MYECLEDEIQNNSLKKIMTWKDYYEIWAINNPDFEKSFSELVISTLLKDHFDNYISNSNKRESRKFNKAPEISLIAQIRFDVKNIEDSMLTFLKKKKEAAIVTKRKEKEAKEAK